MKPHLAALALLALAACSKSPEPPAAAPAAEAATEKTAAEKPAEAAAESSPESAPASAQAAAKPAGGSGDEAAPLLTAGLVAGRDYILISDGSPFDTAVGKVELVEFFNYACPACNAFNPQFSEWKKKLGADVHVVYAPLDFRPDFVQYARAYYAAEALGVADKAHEAVYDAIHQLHTLPGEGQPPDQATIAEFYSKFYGVRQDEFLQLMDGFAVNAKIGRARAFAMKSQVRSTPSLVINGRYLVKGESWDDMLKISDQLIQKERAN